MKRIIISILAALLLITAMAIPIYAASYQFNIAVTESAGNSYTKLPLVFDAPISNMVSGGYMSSTGLDVQVLDGATQLPVMLASDKIAAVSDISARTTKNLKVTTGNTPAASMPIVVGQGGYVTTADNSTWEPHDNFELEFSVYLKNTGTVFEKHDAIKLSYNASTEVLTLITGNNESPDYTLTATGVEAGLHTIKMNVSHTGGTSESVFIYPAGPGDYENITGENPNGMAHSSILSYADGVRPNDKYDSGTAWVWTDDNYVIVGSGNYTSDLYTFDPVSVGSFTDLIVHIYGVSNYNYSYWKPLLKIGGTVYTGDETNLYDMGIEHYPAYYTLGQKTVTYETNPATGLSWNGSDLVNAEFGFSAKQNGTGIHYIGGMAIELTNAGYLPVLNLFVDDMVTPEDSEDLTIPIPDTSSDWLWYPAPYFNYIKLDTGD